MFKLKKPLIIGGVIVAVGAVMMIGSVGHANFDFGWDKGIKLVDVKKSEQTFKGVKSLNVNANSGVIAIEQGPDWSVTSWAIDGRKAAATQKGDTLSVEAIKGEGYARGAFLSTPEAFQYSAKITVPYGTKIENLNLTMDDGGIVMDDIDAHTTKITSGTGGANLRGFTGDTLSMTTKDGRLSLDDVNVNKLHVEGRDAHVYGSFLTVAKAGDITLRDGNVKFSMVTAPGLNLNTGDYDNARVYVTKSSEDEAFLDTNNPDFDYKNDLDIENKQEMEQARKKHEVAQAQRKYTKGNQDAALKVTVRDGQINLYDMKK